jgi:hypothetical protein
MADKEEKGVSLFTADDSGTFEAVSGREDTGGSETARTHDKGPERYKTPGLSTPEVKQHLPQHRHSHRRKHSLPPCPPHTSLGHCSMTHIGVGYPRVNLSSPTSRRCNEAGRKTRGLEC